jgi:general secretion pathway protein E
MSNLTAELIADVLERQGEISGEQAAGLKKEARFVSPSGDLRTSEEKSAAYDFVTGLKLESSKQPTATIDEEAVARALAMDAGLDYIRIDPLKLNAELIEDKISRPFARRHRMIPLEIVNGRMRVACANPFDMEGIDAFRRISGRQIDIVIASEPDILRALTEFYGLRHSVRKAAIDLEAGLDLGNLEQLVRMKSESEIESSDQHIVNAVEYMLQHAYDTRASDIHIEPKREDCLIRFRIDGVLHDVQKIPKLVHRAVVSRIKTMSRLDIAERRRPQDGRAKTQRGDSEIELRVSTLPVAFGEKLVLRVFDPDTFLMELPALGFYPDEMETFNQFIARPHGIILVTGPTGSGKTTTLYSALRQIAASEINVTTIEDPIEIVCEEFNQIAVQPKVGVTFSVALRHVLRQDPDVIMVGEIRDAETAHYAIQAALTGHLVLSTLHTNDAASSISRLIDLEVEPFLISSTLVGAMAQRLVRRTCKKCAGERHLSPDEIRTLRLSVPDGKSVSVIEGQGCGDCRGTGYLGRTAIFEVLPIDEPVKHLIQEQADAPRITREAVQNGMRTLRQSALQKLAEGKTSFEEVVRVTGL